MDPHSALSRARATRPTLIGFLLPLHLGLSHLALELVTGAGKTTGLRKEHPVEPRLIEKA